MNANTQEQPLDDPSAALAVEVLRVLADPTRLRLSGALLHGERSVSELADLVQRPVPAVSQHLARMRMAHLVATRKVANHVLYRIENEHLRALIIDTLRHVEHLQKDAPAHRSH